MLRVLLFNPFYRLGETKAQESSHVLSVPQLKMMGRLVLRQVGQDTRSLWGHSLGPALRSLLMRAGHVGQSDRDASVCLSAKRSP